MRAFNSPGVYIHCGKVRYLYTPEVLNGALWCFLPSGRPLCYPGLTREHDEQFDRFVLTAIKGSRRPKKGEEWPRTRLWHGLLAENITQAVAADILRYALREAVLDADLPVIGHTHDEIICEGEDTGQLQVIMETPPPWAEGLPLKVEMGSGPRYGK